MKSKRISLIATGLLLAVAAQSASAGLIRDGKEWEVRGTPASWEGQSTQAAADAGWTWATEAEWEAAFASPLFVTDLIALGVPASASTGYLIAWLADAPFIGPPPGGLPGDNPVPPPTTPDTARLLRIGGFLPCGNPNTCLASVLVDDASLNDETYRLSYRSLDVPTPSTASLLGLSLALLGWHRRRNSIGGNSIGAGG